MTEIAAQPPAPTFAKVEQGAVVGNGEKPVRFDPAKHMCFKAPETTHLLKDLGLESEAGISPIGITAPFPLFTTEGVRQIRKDLFRPEIMKQFSYKVTDQVCKLRGHGAATPFVYEAWHSDAIQQACSKAAQCELEVVFDYEIAHTNVQVGSASTFSNLPELPPAPVASRATDEAKEETDIAADPLVAWHRDSYNFVCVVMLSDPTGMRGGETALRKGDGSILKVRGPQMGWAVLMQGSAISHVALKAYGGAERITIVTSFRPKGINTRDGSTLRTVKRVSNLDVLFRQWSSYRMELIAKRAADVQKKVDGGSMSAEEIKREMSKWVDEQITYLKNTISEME